MNKNGFMMAEVIVVSAVVMVTLVGLYTSYNKIFSLYNQRLDYYDVATLYELANIRDNYLYPDNVGGKKVDGGKTIYYVSTNSVKNKTIDTDGLKKTFKEYLDYLSTSLDYNSMVINESVIKNLLIMENCSDANNCKYAYLEVLDDDAILAPKCSLSVSGTTITASVNKEDAISYMGWDTNKVNDNGILTKSIDGVGTYTFTIVDTDDNVGTCSLKVTSTSTEKKCPSGYSECSGSGCECYKNLGSASVIKTYKGECWCQSPGASAREPGSCDPQNGCMCDNLSAAVILKCNYDTSYSCSSGSLSGTSCISTKSMTTDYTCGEGIKINNNYCYKIG